MTGAVLCDTDIRQRLPSLIKDFEDSLLSGASYDMRLGPECFTRGETVWLTDKLPSYRLSPGQFILLTSREQLDMPTDLVARAGLVSKWAQRGLISLFSPQVDPGFLGLIVVPLFNGGQSTVMLGLDEPMFTIEFVRLSSPASFAWRDKHKPLLKIPQSAREVVMDSPDLSKLAADVARLEREDVALQNKFEGLHLGTGQKHARSGLSAAWWAVAIAVLAFLAAVPGVLALLDVI